MRGILKKAHKDKQKNAVCTELVQNIEKLETNFKKRFAPSKSQDLQAMYEDLKILDAQRISLEILYPKQKVFDYRDKPRKQLARILAGSSAKVKVSPVKVDEERSTDDSEEKPRNPC